MRISRDEAREVAVMVLLIAIALRIGSGLVQGVEELDRAWTWRSLAGRVFAPIGSSIGLMALGVGLLVALSPSGSVSSRLAGATRAATATVTMFGLAAALNTLTGGFSGWAGRLWFSMMNGLTAALLAGAAWWILANLDPDR